MLFVSVPLPGVSLAPPQLLWVVVLLVLFWWWWVGVVVSCQHLESFAGRSMRFMLMVFSFLTAGSIWDHFSMLGKTLDLSLSSLFCNSTQHLIFAIHSCFYGIGYCLFVIFVTSKTSFVQLLVCISLTDLWWAVYSHGPHCRACPPSHPVPVPLCATSFVSTSPAPAVVSDCSGKARVTNLGPEALKIHYKAYGQWGAMTVLNDRAKH